jgi:hypothetical protein
MSSQMMQAAARGALSVQSGEMMEILVHLALHNKVFGEQARMTLAGWDEKASISVAADPATSKEVLDYLVSPRNLRPALLPALLENPSVEQEKLLELAGSGARWVVEALLVSEPAKKSSALMTALRSNPRLRAIELAALENPALKEASPEPSGTPEFTSPAQTTNEEPATTSAVIVDSEPADEEAVSQAIASFLQQNQAELATLPDKPFEPVVVQEGTGVEGAIEVTASPPATATAAPSTAPVGRPVKKPGLPTGGKRDSTLQKIAKLDITGRIALAMRGTKEERSLLIRDGTKLVALAVLDSPKVSDGEVENFAQQKNVLEAVLRGIPMKRRFMKNYSVVRNLVYNPRTPLDLSLGLMKNLLVHDLKNLSGNKEVSDTIRKLATRMFKQKSEKKN